MFKSMYLERKTAIHRLDPRTKIISLLNLSIMLFIFNSPPYIGAMALGLVGLGALAQSLRNYYKVRYLMLVFLVVTFVVWQFYLRGPTVVGHLGPLTLTRESLLYGLAAGIRFVSILMLGTLFVSTIKVEELMLGLIRLGVPYTIAFILSTAARLVPTFASAATTIVQAQIARGLDLSTRNPLRRATKLLPVIIPFLIYTSRYASQLSMALETKGFNPSARRTYYLELRMAVTDYIVLASLLALTTMFLVLRLKGYGAVLPGRI